MSIKSEKQFKVIIEKLDQLLAENIQLKTLITQKDDPNQGNLFSERLFSEPEQTDDQSDEEEVIVTAVCRRNYFKSRQEC